MNREQVIEVLLTKTNLPKEQLNVVVEEKEKTGAPFGYLLIKFGLLSFEQWYSFALKELKLASINLSQIDIDRNVATLLPEFTCKKYRVIPVYRGGNKLICGMVDPSDDDVVRELEKITSLQIEPRLANEKDIKETIEKYFSHGHLDVLVPSVQKGKHAQVLKPSGVIEISDSSAVQAVEDIISKGVELKATDIHIEIEEDGVKLRYRINGLLYKFPPPPLELYTSIISHIKVLSLLDIAEKRIPQDGYFKIKLPGGRDVDLRVSSYPTIFGEMIAMRVLDKRNIVSGLERLGFLPQTLHRWRILLDEPYGILLVTGPTGSGKTTVLYSSLNELDSERKKIMTVEDPVEYHLANVDQTQISPKAGLTFQVALRSILRQDPDVVMVGEIRDLETAEIAFRAAQTGQLVFSTLHTNTAPGAVIRLVDMGVEPYLISSSLAGVLNQRLVRSICTNCKEEYTPSQEEVKEVGISLEHIASKFYRGKGCHLCNGTGFGSRTGIFELMVVNEEIRRNIMKNPEINILNELAKSAGMKTLREDGIVKVLEGKTTVSEILYSTKKENN
ncbi:Flp pilus assembly complex ATPase component TadA [bacterium]|nr:Flp pilus assembly complex ATPase component TadA [bacterium]